VIANKEEIKKNEDAEVVFERVKENLSYEQIIEFRNDFNDTIKSFLALELDFNEISELFKICAAILHLGNIKVECNGKNEVYIPDSEMKFLSKFLNVLDVKNVDEIYLKKILSEYSRKVGGTTEIFPRSVADAKQSIDSFCKKL